MALASSSRLLHVRRQAAAAPAASWGASCSPRCTDAPSPTSSLRLRAARSGSSSSVAPPSCALTTACKRRVVPSARVRPQVLLHGAQLHTLHSTSIDDFQLHYGGQGQWLQDGQAEPRAYDVLGLAQSMVDVTTEGAVHDELLPQLSVEKGGRRVLSSADERHQVLQTLDEAGCTTRITPGGSLANTLVAISRLSSAAASRPYATRQRPLHVALGTSCGKDPIGQFFASQLNTAGVAVLPASGPDAAPGHTGTVFVLPSPDAQRSFLSYFHSDTLTLDQQLLKAAARCRLLIIEGYLWELPGAAAAIHQVLAAARAGGARVALTAGDPGVVQRHRQEILEVLEAGGKDILFFANMEEACELVGQGRSCCAATAAEQLSLLCSVAVVTDGGNGSHVACGGRVTSVPPVEPPSAVGVVDTCGAGDAYAAGFVFALASGCTCPHAAGAFAGLVAAQVISHHGAQLQVDDARSLVPMMPDPSGAAGLMPALPRRAAAPAVANRSS